MNEQELDEFQRVCNGELDTSHSLTEFSSFPWNMLDDDWFDRIGGFGTNGDYKPFISFHRKNGSIDKWEIPVELKRLLTKYEEDGE